MRAQPHLTFAAIFALLLVTNRAGAQDNPPDLTAEEIVARHEATWNKLSRLKLEFITTSLRRQFYDCGNAAIGMPKYSTEATNVRLYVNANRLSGYFRETAPKAEEQETKEILEDEYRVSLHPTGVFFDSINSNTSRHYATFRYGRSVGLSGGAKQMSLREFASQAHPTITRDQSDPQATKWILKGKVTTDTTSHYDSKPSSRTDEVEVVLNEAKGFAVERVEFKCPPSKTYADTRATLWTVKDWKDLGNGLFFPSKTRWEASLVGLDDKHSMETEFTSIQVDPADLDDQFKMELKEGAVIYDYTRRPGTSAVSIWGPNDKPKQTFRTIEEYRTAQGPKTPERVAW